MFPNKPPYGYWALHENDKKTSFFGDLFIIQVRYESMWKRDLFSN